MTTTTTIAANHTANPVENPHPHIVLQANFQRVPPLLSVEPTLPNQEIPVEEEESGQLAGHTTLDRGLLADKGLEIVGPT